jgi:NADH-quinone oxidoreductase subunit N
VLFYLLTYAVMTIGIFGVLLLLQKQGERADKVEDLDGLASSRPVAAILLAVFLLGLTGLPPTVGFWAKFNLFIVAWANGSLLTRILAIALALNAAMAAWYYLRPIKHAFLNDALTVSDTSRRPAPALYSVLGLCTLLTIGIFLFPNSLWRLLSGLG